MSIQSVYLNQFYPELHVVKSCIK